MATAESGGTPRPLSGPHPTVDEAEAARDFLVRLLNVHPQLHILGRDPQRSVEVDLSPHTPPST